MSIKGFIKIGVIIGSSLFGSKTFCTKASCNSEAALLGFAGAVIGGYIGITVTNNLDEMLTNAFKAIEEDEELKETVNG